METKRRESVRYNDFWLLMNCHPFADRLRRSNGCLGFFLGFVSRRRRVPADGAAPTLGYRPHAPRLHLSYADMHLHCIL